MRNEKKEKKKHQEWFNDYMLQSDMVKWLTFEEYCEIREEFNKKYFTYPEVEAYKNRRRPCEHDANIKCPFPSCFEGCEIYYEKYVNIKKCPNCGGATKKNAKHCDLCGWKFKKEEKIKKIKIELSPYQRREIWIRDKGKCVICGSKERLEYDYILPVNKGGTGIRNIQLLCEKCYRYYHEV